MAPHAPHAPHTPQVPQAPQTIAAIRAKLEGRTGEQYWRSLDELAETPEFRTAVDNEFPAGAPVWDDPVGRRRFLHVMGASIALAGLSSCVKQPDEKILPYVKQPEYLIPGKPLTFASAFSMNGFATGVLVTSHMGRPTKIQGNPDHPASLGSADVFSMASILHLYDPDRSQVVRRKGEITTLNKFLAQLEGALDAQKPLGGRGLRILTGTVTSPTIAWQIGELLKLFPQARWHRYETAGIANERGGSMLAFGEHAQPVYHLDRADVVFSLDSDFLAEGPAHLKYARDFAKRRKIEGTKAELNRFYAAESFPTVTGSVADHRLPVRGGRIADVASRLAELIGVEGVTAVTLTAAEERFVAAAADDLKSHRGAAIVIAGAHQPAEVHALAHAINEALGGPGSTVTFVRPAEYDSHAPESSLGELTAELRRGDVDLLLIAGGNPVYDAPAEFGFAEALAKPGMSISMSLYNDETARECGWHVPESHYLEAWGDARAFDGTASIVQPLIAPLYNTLSLCELLTEMVGKSGKKGYEIVREYWKNSGMAAAGRGGEDFESFWRSALNDGVISGTASAATSPRFRGQAAMAAMAGVSAGLAQRGNAAGNSKLSFPGSDVEIAFRPDPTVGDGTFSNNGWLQELPKPVTKLTWDNAAFVSPSMAEELALADEEVVEISANGAMVSLPVLVLPGHPVDAITLHLGYGRKHAGRVGTGTGVDVYPLRTSATPSWARGSIGKTGLKRRLAGTQDHGSMEGRPIFRTATVPEFRENPHFAHEMAHAPKQEDSLYPPVEYPDYKWAMTIDLNACTGCNACVIGCQSENNIPVTGKDQVLNGREMHWIRIDRYYNGDLDNPEIYSQPVACMHCENAPCEPVCPVAATSHDHEGLNVMVYNRCVGTRYCSNNCPYKVRRFNFLQYADVTEPSVQMMYNPDVTVRNRGVMEKCTYCVQRISAARIDAKKEGRSIRDGDIVTACQSACPSQAIVFGDMNDKESAIAKSKAEPRAYGLLAELNTAPRTSYLARISNPNPALLAKQDKTEKGEAG
jgi:molybdopterin-containing oxidoreductase family iron-sulfur binding subunit